MIFYHHKIGARSETLGECQHYLGGGDGFVGIQKKKMLFFTDLVIVAGSGVARDGGGDVPYPHRGPVGGGEMTIASGRDGRRRARLTAAGHPFAAERTVLWYFFFFFATADRTRQKKINKENPSCENLFFFFTTNIAVTK